MSEKESKIIEKLMQVDINKNEAKVLFYLFKVNESFARDVEKGADLRQPEVSNSTKKLLERGWIKSISIKSSGKGRPQYKYSLTMKKSDICKAINKIFMDKIHSLEKNMNDINQLLGEK